MRNSDDPATERGSRQRFADRLGAIADAFDQRFRDPAWGARAVGIGLCLVSLGFVVTFGIALGRGGELALITRPLSVRIALSLPYLVVLCTIGTGSSAVVAWWRGHWSVLARIHQTILAVLGIGFVWQLRELGFLML